MDMEEISDKNFRHDMERGRRLSIGKVVDLAESRKKIDEIDAKIVALFKERMDVATDVAAYKRSTGKKVFDPEREEQKLSALRDMVDGKFNKTSVEDLFRQIMSISRKHQYQVLGPREEEIPFEEVEHIEITRDTRVAYFGEPGSFTEQAMFEMFGNEVQAVHKGTFREIMQAVSDGEAAYGILPIENSTTGAVEGINDLLMEYGVTIIAEHVIAIRQQLLAAPGTRIEDVRTVFSHQQGILQCEKFIREHDFGTKTDASTSAAAMRIAEKKNPAFAAIAGKRAAEVFGLEILAEDINDEQNNFTRFIVVTNQRIFLADAGKLSLCLELKHQVGALYNILANFYYNGLNLTKIESRPIENKNWEYRFFIDVEGNVNSPGVENALATMREFASKLSILGNVAKR